MVGPHFQGEHTYIKRRKKIEIIKDQTGTGKGRNIQKQVVTIFFCIETDEGILVKLKAKPVFKMY